MEICRLIGFAYLVFLHDIYQSIDRLDIHVLGGVLYFHMHNIFNMSLVMKASKAKFG